VKDQVSHPWKTTVLIFTFQTADRKIKKGSALHDDKTLSEFNVLISRIYEFSPYRKENTKVRRYKHQLVNAV
jgi:hypothetical protein